MSVEFSADAERRALAPWSIEIDGRVHTARPISRPAIRAFWAVVERSKAGTATLAEEEAAIETLLRAAFPRRRFADWWRGDPVPQILALDFRVREKALESFYASLAPPDDPSPPGTSGMSGSSSS